MPLVKYFQYLTYADGQPAANAAFPVQLLGGNVLTPLFSDKPGAVPLANPIMTDGDGLATFYAAPGDFATDISGNVFHYDVDPTETDEAWPGLFIHEQAVAATVWTVNHRFGVQPTVTVLVDGARVEATVAHPSSETTTITFSPATAGTAFLRR